MPAWAVVGSAIATLAPVVPALEWLRRRRAGGWFVLGLLVSLVADLAAWGVMGRDGWITYAFAPVQIVLFVSAVSQGPVRWTVGVGVVLLGVLSALRGPLDRYELIVEGVGLPLVAYLAWNAQDRVTRAIRSYCVWTIFPLIGLSLWPTLGWWTGYQVVRVGAIGRFAWALGREGDHDLRTPRRGHLAGGDDLAAPRPLGGLGPAPPGDARGMATGHPGSQGVEPSPAGHWRVLPGHRGSHPTPGNPRAVVAGGG